MITDRNIDIFIGDSTVDGYKFPEYTDNHDYVNIQKLPTWAKLFCAADHAIQANHARASAGWLANYNYAKQYDDAMAMHDHARIRRIIFSGVANDFWNKFAPEQVVMAMTRLLKRAKVENPDAQIIWVTQVMPPSPRNLKELAGLSFASKLLIKTVQDLGVEAADATGWLSDTTDTWVEDELHPNKRGHQLAATKMVEFINSTNLPVLQ